MKEHSREICYLTISTWQQLFWSHEAGKKEVTDQKVLFGPISRPLPLTLALIVFIFSICIGLENRGGPADALPC